MNNHDSKDLNLSQSAVDNVQVKGNFSVGGDISQNQIINLLRDEYIDAESIRAEYKEKIDDLKSNHKACVRSAQESVRIEMKSLRKAVFLATKEKYSGEREILKENHNNPMISALFGPPEFHKLLDSKMSKGEKVADNLI